MTKPSEIKFHPAEPTVFGGIVQSLYTCAECRALLLDSEINLHHGWHDRLTQAIRAPRPTPRLRGAK